jgi:hypothetical protein
MAAADPRLMVVALRNALREQGFFFLLFISFTPTSSFTKFVTRP